MSHDFLEKNLSFFEPPVEQRRTLNAALADIVASRQKIALAKFMLKENTLHYKHASSWSYPANDFAKPGEMESISAEFTVPFQRTVDADMTLITESVSSIANQLTAILERKIYEAMGEACDRSGNVIENKNLTDSILEAMEKVEFSVDANGNVQLPQLHMHPDHASKLKDLPTEFLDKLEDIKERKSNEAVAKELARKSKYKVLEQ